SGSRKMPLRDRIQWRSIPYKSVEIPYNPPNEKYLKQFIFCCPILITPGPAVRYGLLWLMLLVELIYY
ncbi:MAG: hypothetical protein WBF05_05350, partial [Anaerolineales bacterium]